MAEKTLVGRVVGYTRVVHLKGPRNKRKVTEFSVESDKSKKTENMKIHGKHDLLIPLIELVLIMK